MIVIMIEADGFLYKMVRNIVGTLLQIGAGQIPAGSLKMILKNKDRNAAGYTAKARGLALMEVQY
jgi:tRNA pseudouridine38-40 synthase